MIKSKLEAIISVLGIIVTFLMTNIIIIGQNIDNKTIVNSAVIAMILSITIVFILIFKIYSDKVRLEQLDKIPKIFDKIDEVALELMRLKLELDKEKALRESYAKDIQSLTNNLNDFKKIINEDIRKTVSVKNFSDALNRMQDNIERNISKIYLSKNEASLMYKRKSNIDIINKE